jgi:hypothetical protein
MILAATQLTGAWLIDLEPREDERGFFARTWCRQELSAQGLDTEIAQESLSFNLRRPSTCVAARCAGCISNGRRTRKRRSRGVCAVRSMM